MRFLLRLFAAAMLAAVLVVAVIAGDFFFNNHRLLYAVMGRDTLVAACRPVLETKLKAAGFEPQDLAFGGDVALSFSTVTGRALTGSFTFEDGASQTRVDGIVACSVVGQTVTVEMRTLTTPMRAT